MLTAVMLGSTSMAYAQVTNTVTCNHPAVASVVAVCSTTVGDLITVTTDDILSDNDIDAIQNVLNDPDVVDLDALNNLTVTALNNVLNGSNINVLNVTVNNVCVSGCTQ